MNKIYRVIWSKSKKCYVVVSEIAKRHTKSNATGRSAVRGLLAGTVLLSLTAGMCSPVWASATINTQGNQTYTIVDGQDVEAQADGNNIKLNVKKINIGNGYFTVAENGTVTAHGNTIIDANGKLLVNSLGVYNVLNDAYNNATIIAAGSNTATGQYAKSIGSGTTAIGDFSTAWGQGSTAKGLGTTSFGYQTKAYGTGSVAWGNNAVAGKDVTLDNQGFNATAWGDQTLADGRESTAWGDHTHAEGLGATAWGKGKDKAGALGDWSTAFGNGTTASASEALAFGLNTTASGIHSVAGGEGSTAEADDAVAFGMESHAYGKHSLAVGKGATTKAGTDSTVALGYEVQANGDHSFATGFQSIADGADSIAMGNTAKANGADAVAVGSSTSAVAEGVALGKGSVANTKSSEVGYHFNLPGTYSGATWVPTNNDAAVGNGATLTRRITGVAAGSNDTDAVNVAQLKVLENQIEGNSSDYRLVGSDGNDGAGETNKYTVQNGKVTLKVKDMGSESGDVKNVVLDLSSIVPEGRHYFAYYSEGRGNWNNDGAKGEYSLAIGPDARAGTEGNNDTVSWNFANGDHDITLANGDRNTVAVGFKAIALGNGSVAMGYNAFAINAEGQGSGHDLGSVAVGSNVGATGSRSVAIGWGDPLLGVQAVGSNSTAIGSESVKASGLSAIAIGHQVATNGNSNYSVAMGHNVSVGKTTDVGSTVAIGDDINVNKGDQNQVIGSHRTVEGYTNTVIGSMPQGYDATEAQKRYITGNSNVVLGYWSSTWKANNAHAYGYRVDAKADNSIAIGSKTAVEEGANNSIAIGARESYGYAVGEKSKNAIAIGYGALVDENINDSIAIGTKAKLLESGANSSVVIGDSSYTYAANSIALGHNAKINYGDAVSSIAIGDEAAIQTEKGKYAIAIGRQAKANNESAIAVGQGSTASGEKSIAIGTSVSVSGNNSGAFGDPTTVSGANSYSIGNSNSISAEKVFALGNNIKTVTSNSAFLGDSAAYVASGTSTGGLGEVKNATVGGVTYGDFAGATPKGVVSVGAVGTERRLQNVAAGLITKDSTDAINGSQLFAALNASEGPEIHYFAYDDFVVQHNHGNYDNEGAVGHYSVAIGPDARAGTLGNNEQITYTLDDTKTVTAVEGDSHTTAIGHEAMAIGGDSVALGYKAYAVHPDPSGSYGKGSVAVGSRVEASDSHSVALGFHTKAHSQNSVAIGVDAITEGPNALSVGSSAKANGGYSIGIGYNGTAYGTSSVAIGQNAIAGQESENENGSYQVVVGANRKVTGSGSIGIGYTRNANLNDLSGQNSIAIGYGATTKAANQALASGFNAEASGNAAIALGDQSAASAASAVAIGDGSKVTKTNSVAVGTGNEISAEKVFALGNNIKTVTSNSAFLGDSAAYVVKGDSTGGLGEVKNATVSGFQFGNFAGPTPVGVVSVGAVGSVRRLQNVAAGLITKDSTDAINGSQLFAAIDAMQFDIVAGDNVEVIKSKDENSGHTVYTIHSLNAIVQPGTNNTVTVDGEVGTGATNGKTTDLTPDSTGSDAGNGADAGTNGGTTATTPKPTPSEEAIVPSDNSHTTTYTVDAADSKVTDVAVTNSTPTTTGNKTETEYTVTVTSNEQSVENGKIVTKEVKKEDTFTVTDTDTKYTAEQTTEDGNDYGSGSTTFTVSEMDGEKTGAAVGAATLVAGENVKITKGEDGSAIISAQSGGGAAEISFNGDNKDAQIDNPKVLNIEGGATGELTEGNIGVISDGEDTLTVKLAKDIKDVDTITVNKTIKVGDKTTIEGDKITVGDTVIEGDQITTKTFKAGDTTINNDGLTINNGPSITKNGIDAGGKKITNVAPGTDDTDAVNVSQLRESNQNIYNSMNRLDDSTRKGIAGAAALAALHPLDFDPDDKWEFSAGVGNYRGETAAAIGAFYHPNDDTIFSLGATVGNGENLVNGGVTFRFGQNNHQSRSKKAMAKEIVELRAEVAELKALVYNMASGKMPGLDLTRTEDFPDTPENHWAYDYVSVLAGNGVLEGYPDGYFKGDRTLTRYEMAAIIYRAMMKGVDVDERMAEEFAPELARVKVDTLTSHNDGTPSIQRVRVIKGRE